MYKISDNTEYFLALPEILYKNDPFYKAEQKIPEGKLFVIQNKVRACLISGPEYAQIGYFEAYDEPDAVKFLFDNIKEYCKNSGVKKIIGPMNGSTWKKYRVTLPDSNPPFFLDNYNKPYYAKLFAENGFMEIARYASTVFRNLEKDYSSVSLYEKTLAENGITVTNFDNNLKDIYDISVRSFTNNFLYTPISFEEFADMYKPLMPLINPDWIYIVKDRQQNAIAFMFAIDNILGNKSVIAKTMAKLPDCNIKGIGTYLLSKIHELAYKRDYNEVIHAFMHKENISAKILNQDGELLHEYALYGFDL